MTVATTSMDTVASPTMEAAKSSAIDPERSTSGMKPMRRKNPINSRPPVVSAAAVSDAIGLRTTASASAGADLRSQP